MDELLAKKVLKEVKEVLDANDVEFWLNFGGLLGAVRDGRLIPYDDDVELNAWKHKVTEQKMKDVSRELCKRGFNVYYSTLTDYISIRKNGIPIAFSMYTLKGDKAERPHEPYTVSGISTLISKLFLLLSEIFARNRVGKVSLETVRTPKSCTVFLAVTLTKLIPQKTRRKLSVIFRKMSIKTRESFKGNEKFGRAAIPAVFYLKLQDFEFYGETFKVPKPPEEYVRFVYGPDWRTPLKDWKFPDHCNRNITGVEFVDDQWEYTCS